jgi:hypothetical protein
MKRPGVKSANENQTASQKPEKYWLKEINWKEIVCKTTQNFIEI